MKDVQETLLDNLIRLRKSRGLTQIELGEQINYSDKTISKWEKGDSCPNIGAIYRLAQFYRVTVDELLSDDIVIETVQQKNQSYYSKIVIALLAVISVWIISVTFFIYGTMMGMLYPWKVMIYAVPASCLVTLFFNTKWGRKSYNYLIISVFLWTFLTSFYIRFLGFNLWMIYLLGIPLQIAIILWSQLKRPATPKPTPGNAKKPTESDAKSKEE